MGTTHAIRTQQKKARFLSLLLCLLMLLGSVAELAACTSGDTTETASAAPSGTEQTTDVPSSATATQGEPEGTTEPETESSAAADTSEDTSADTSEDTSEDTSADTSEDTSAETNDATESETAEIETSGEADRKGKEFRILSATRAPAGMASSNCFLEGEQNTAGTINEAVHERNTAVELELDVALTFSHADADKSDIQSEIKRLVMSGTDAYDLVISELLPFASLANDGTFRNILSSEFTGFDFENKPYWHKEYMDDLRLVNGYEYLLAGDFFIDVLRSSHLLLFNKEMYRDHYRRDPGEVFEWVLNYEWTYEKLNGIITDMYLDKNGNSRRDYGDRWGLSISDLRSAKIGFIVSADPGLVSRSEDGTPRIVLGDTSRMADLTQRLSLLLFNSSCYISDAAGGNSLRDFTEGSALLCEGHWLGSLENTALPDMKEGAGVLPYPQLYASDKRYITATSNTANVGAVLLTAKDEAFISTVIQALNRETASRLIPKYYRDALKLRYDADPYTAGMIRILHDNIGGSFMLAYGNQAIDGSGNPVGTVSESVTGGIKRYNTN